jgi:hypothetical protein
MRLHEGEPQFAVAEVVRVDDLVDRVVALAPEPTGPFLLAIDGRSASGKTTLAGRVAAHVPGAAVVHTDDVAWWHSRFGWDDLLLEGIIRPLRGGLDVSYRPPPWDARDRPGAICVRADAPIVVIEGVGSGRRSLQRELDAVIWVQTDRDVTDARDALRVAAGEVDQADYDGWMAEENPFQQAERTWERADILVSGGSPSADDPDEVVLLR